VLVGSKVRYLSNFSAAPHFGERPETGRVSDAGPARAIDQYRGAGVGKPPKNERAGKR
jgi:hypothetical protein